MAEKKPSQRRPRASGTLPQRASAGKRADAVVRKSASKAPPPKQAAGKRAAGRRAADPKPVAKAPAPLRPSDTPRSAPPARRAKSDAERDRQFSVLLHTACLKAGTAAVVTTLTTRVPLLNRVAPLLVGSLAQSLAVPRIQQQLVSDVLSLYGLELSELEQQGVILLATAANVGAQELSRRTVEQLVDRIGKPLGRPILDRMLPVTHLVAENAAAIASTYAVGRRAQALCRLSGSGARDLGELLGTITGIDQRRLLDWSSEAVKMALKPFRAALLTLKPLG